MAEENPATIDIDQILAALKPPRTPDETFDADNRELAAIVEWDRSLSVSILSGLLTEPGFFANGIRLDWLQRLVLAKSTGTRAPTSQNLASALNAGLARARVSMMEDPSENQFCSLIATPFGNFRIFNGQWLTPGPFTQTLLDAFLQLPDSKIKNLAVLSAYGALVLSEELARRAGVAASTETGGEPQGEIQLPSNDALDQLAARAKFSFDDIERLGVTRQMLSPYGIETRQLQYVGSYPPGDTPLEFHPFLLEENGLIVVSPPIVPLAIRALLIKAAQEAGVCTELVHLLLKRQQLYAESSLFWPSGRLQLSEPDEYLLRCGAREHERGHFLQVIQIPPTIDKFPKHAFGSMIPLGDEACDKIASYIHLFWASLAKRADCRSSTTVLLLSGWGTPHTFELRSLDPAQEPAHWQFLPISFAEAAILGAVQDGKFTSVTRICRQVSLLEHEGFVLDNRSGLVNLFGFWRSTNGHLIPENEWGLTPPCTLSMPTDCLREVEAEAVRKMDVRTIPLSEGDFRVVQRVDWEDEKPIYASLDEAAQGRMLGCVLLEQRTWWLECVMEEGADRGWYYRAWNAVLEWLAAVGRHVLTKYPQAYPPRPNRATLEIHIGPLQAADLATLADDRLADAVEVLMATETTPARICVSPDWQLYLQRAENDAEVELAAATLQALADPAYPVSRSEFRGEIIKAIGSRDWRHMHSHRAKTVLDRLESQGLVDGFHRLPASALSLAKCGSIWRFRRREEGAEIEGEGACAAFLAQYDHKTLTTLIEKVRRFDRMHLTRSAAKRYQSARAEQQAWRRTIRALRAIGGTVADRDAFRRQGEINAVQRAAKTVCEVAACEAPEIGGLTPARYDLDDMFATALLLFGNGQLFSAIRSGLIEPKLRVSPAGDLLSNRSIFDRTLRPAAEISNKRLLDDAAESYLEDRQPGRRDKASKPWDGDLSAALTAEYGDSDLAFLDLQVAVSQIAESGRTDVFVMRRSELCTRLNENTEFPKGDHAPLLARLTLPRRASWSDKSSGATDSDIELSRLDRPLSLINRPLLALDESSDPLLLIAPVLISDATMYSLSGLMNGRLNNRHWVSREARRYAGMSGKEAGERFEQEVGDRLRQLGMETKVRCKLSDILNQKVDKRLGDVDVLAISQDRRRVWVIEAKNLRLCRTEAEVASRMSEYRGRIIRRPDGKEEPDKLMRHISRVRYLREHRVALGHRLKLGETPEVRGLLVVDAPQPMNFYMLENIENASSITLDLIDEFNF